MELGIITELRKENVKLESELTQKNEIIRQLKELVKFIEHEASFRLDRIEEGHH